MSKTTTEVIIAHINIFQDFQCGRNITNFKRQLEKRFEHTSKFRCKIFQSCWLCIVKQTRGSI